MNKIEKIDLLRDQPQGPFKAIEDKLNELIEAYNHHYHESMDTHYNTGSPKHTSFPQ